jgi:hypothetical protein
MRIFHLVEAESLWALSQRGAVNLPQVKELQDKLRAAGFDPGPSDGWYGRNTANAVRRYQEANGLTVDGDAGPQTLGSLGMGGVNNTPPRETPPEETPPAPAPRQPEREPADQPAAEPAPRDEIDINLDPTPRREPEPRSEPATSNSFRFPSTFSGNESISFNDSRRSIRQLVDRVGQGELVFDSWMPNRRNESAFLYVDLKNDGSIAREMMRTFGTYDHRTNAETRRFANQVVNWVKEQFQTVSGDLDLTIAIENPDGQKFDEITIGLTPATGQETEPESEETPEVTNQEKIRILSGFDPQTALVYFGRERVGSANYFIAGVRLDENIPDAVILLGGRQSTAPDAQLQRLGLPRQSFAIYAVSLSRNVGYRLQGRGDYDDAAEAYRRFQSITATNTTYPLDQGSSQYVRRQQIMQRLEQYNPNERDLERIRSQNESISRITALAGL